MKDEGWRLLGRRRKRKGVSKLWRGEDGVYILFVGSEVKPSPTMEFPFWALERPGFTRSGRLRMVPPPTAFDIREVLSLGTTRPDHKGHSEISRTGWWSKEGILLVRGESGPKRCGVDKVYFVFALVSLAGYIQKMLQAPGAKKVQTAA